MHATYNEINNIIKTLPIGYYIGRNVKVTLSEDSECSYYSPMNDEICISFSQLSTAISSLNNNANLEENVRNMTYHEVSHAFITPKNLKVTNVINIVEDERIETVLRNYYMNTNFREFVKRVNNFKGDAPKNVDDAFYQLVRYRIGTACWLDRLHELLMKYRTMNRSTAYYAYDDDSISVYEYVKDVTTFYKEFCEDYAINNQTSNESDVQNAEAAQSNTSDAQTDNAQTNGTLQESTSEQTEQAEHTEKNSQTDKSSSDDANTQSEQSESNDENDENATCSDASCAHEDGKNEYDASIAKASIANAINAFVDQAMIGSINQILARVTKANAKNGSAINSYSGVFDPRAVQRDDYKYFVQKNRLGHVKAFSKIHLNLFIDRSGSFQRSETTANKLLYALTQFEKQNPDFSFDLVTCGYSEKLHEKKDRTLHCGGGNLLDSDIFEIFKSVQLAGQTNYNIVMFDGDAFSDTCYPSRFYKNFAAFNTSNTTIISDLDNEAAIKRNCKSAKCIFTNNYVDELCKNVLLALQNLSR